MGCKTVNYQSWRSEKKSDILDARPILLSKSDSPDSTRTGVIPLSWTSNFDRSQFCGPYDDEKKFIWTPQAISICTKLKKQYSSTFNNCQDILESADLLHKQDLDASQSHSTQCLYRLEIYLLK